MGYIWWI